MWNILKKIFDCDKMERSGSFQSSAGVAVVGCAGAARLSPLWAQAAGGSVWTGPGCNSSQAPKANLRALNSSGIQGGVVCAFKKYMQVPGKITSWLVEM